MTAGVPQARVRPTIGSRMTPTTRAQLQIHLCVLLWGFTAILGKLISMAPLPLVLWRMLMVIAVLAGIPRVWRSWRALPPRLIAAYAGVGGVVALHWLAFYGSIKLSNASVAATCMGLSPVFLALVEPIIVRRPFDPRELLLGVAVVPGVTLVAGGAPAGMRLGIAVGVIAALLVAIFGAFNKRLIGRGDPLTVTGIEFAAGAGLLALLAPLLPHSGPAFPMPNAYDTGLLVVLALGCTLLPFTLSLVALRHLSAFAAQLAINLEPVYAILIASALLGEHRQLTLRFYLGVVILLGGVLVHPLLRRRSFSVTDGGCRP